MPFFHLRLSVPHLPCNHVSNTLLWPTLGSLADYINFQPNAVQPNYHTSVMKNIAPSYVPVSSFPRLHDYGATMQISDNAIETTGFGKYFLSKLCVDSAEKLNSNEGVQLDVYHHSPECLTNQLEGGRRRRKRKHGNKGRTPWNKGRKHSSETCMLIKQRTIEALKDPQVRKKMSEYPRAHSEENKAKISTSLRQLWAKRLKCKRLREKFFLSWAKSIAKAAKKGGNDQQELDWDSYDKIKETTLNQLHCATEKAQAKELTKRAAERAAQAKAEKMARLAQKRKEREEKAKAREEVKGKAHRKSKKTAKDLSVAQELTLQQRLTKIRKKISINGQVVIGGALLSSHSPAWEKLDVELIKREKVNRKEISLADQIRAAKNKRPEPMAMEALAAPSRVHIFAGGLE